MTLYNPLMPWLNPRNSGLIAFGGGGGGASAEEVEQIVDDKIGTPSTHGYFLWHWYYGFTYYFCRSRNW